MSSEKSKQKSEAESALRESDSVYDFLYQDASRVGSFLAQFDPNGHLLGVQTAAQTGQSSGSKTVVRGQGGVPLVANASAEHEQDEGRHWDRSAQRTFDPLWGNALAFLDYLTQRNLIVADLAQAGIGQIVVVSGALSIIDTSTLKALIDTPLFKKGVIAQAAPSGPRQRKAQQAQTEPTELGMAVIALFPHRIQARLLAASGNLWGSILPDGLTVPAPDLLMKHGLQLSGEWSMVGILDAIPDIEDGGNTQPSQGFGPYIDGLAGMIPPVRSLLGRPDDWFGITPLLIFREVSGG